MLVTWQRGCLDARVATVVAWREDFMVVADIQPATADGGQGDSVTHGEAHGGANRDYGGKFFFTVVEA